MSQENMEIVRASFRAFAEEGPEGAAQYADPNLVVTRVDPDGAVFRGVEGLAEATREWTEDFSEWTQRAEDFIDAGERVVVRGHQSARGAASGARVESDFWYVVSLEGGKITELDIYLRREEAFKAVGLSEQDARAGS
jgi:ketosteroid isomerase-like protein